MVGASSLYFIDWETVSVDDPYLDIADFILATSLSEEQVQDFMEAYLGKRPNLGDLCRLELAKFVALVDWGSCLLLKLKQNPIDEVTWKDLPPLDEWLKNFF